MRKGRRRRREKREEERRKRKGGRGGLQQGLGYKGKFKALSGMLTRQFWAFQPSM